MPGQCVVAVYPTRSEAESVKRELLGRGISDEHIQISERDGSSQRQLDEGDGSGFFSWLFGSDITEDDRRMYGSHLMEGRAAVSVYLDETESASASQIEDVLERYNPLDIHEEQAGLSGRTGTSAGAEETEVIPLPQEELEIGKRATERTHRIKTYVVEEPVERDVHLRDERVVVEKRPATGSSMHAGSPQEREYEIRERHEEPVVTKSTRADEEVVVRKEQADRTQRVRDTVRKTQVDLDRNNKS